MSLFRKILCLFSISGLLAACGGGGDQMAEVSTAVGKGYVLSSGVWPSWDIDVCWDMTADDFAKTSVERQAAREGASIWEAVSQVRFNGWGICGANGDQRVRITAVDTGPYTTNLGKLLNNRKGGIVLNFEFNNWKSYNGHNVLCNANADTRTGCIRVTAAHEFGHVLGFAHEQNRTDTPSSCHEPPQGASGDVTVGAWDVNSIMNYCNGQWNGDGKLSPTDIQMVQKYYGTPTPPIEAHPTDISPMVSLILNDDD